MTRQLGTVATDVGDATADAVSRATALASDAVDEATDEGSDIVAGAEGTVDGIAGGQLP